MATDKTGASVLAETDIHRHIPAAKARTTGHNESGLLAAVHQMTEAADPALVGTVNVYPVKIVEPVSKGRGLGGDLILKGAAVVTGETECIGFGAVGGIRPLGIVLNQQFAPVGTVGVMTIPALSLNQGGMAVPGRLNRFFDILMTRETDSGTDLLEHHRLSRTMGVMTGCATLFHGAMGVGTFGCPGLFFVATQAERIPGLPEQRWIGAGMGKMATVASGI